MASLHGLSVCLKLSYKECELRKKELQATYSQHTHVTSLEFGLRAKRRCWQKEGLLFRYRITWAAGISVYLELRKTSFKLHNTSLDDYNGTEHCQR